MTLIFGLADRQSADRVAIESDLLQPGQRLLPAAAS